MLDTDKELKEIGQKLKFLRKSAGYSNPDTFSYEKNINRSQYGKYETGKNLTISTLIKLLNIHKISIKDFFNMEVEG